MSVLFEPLTLRGVTVPNRVWMSPMCQYSADAEGPNTGAVNDWHRTHLESRAVGGVGMVMTEAAAVSPEGRITPWDLGIWNDTQADALAEVVASITRYGSVPAIQLAHAGRKASTEAPWRGGKPLAADHALAWETVGPSAVEFGHYPAPREMTIADIDRVVDDFRSAAIRADRAGFEVAEVHAAHGYLAHQFLSAASNLRTDEYGGSFDNRIRFLLRLVDAVREVWPAEKAVFVRVSATDWTGEERGVDSEAWTPDQTVMLADRLTDHGVDLVDVSTGGNVAKASIPVEPGYQVPFARRIQNETTMPAAAVGLITEPKQAEDIVSTGEAVAVFLARELLRDPYWARRAARELGAEIAPGTPPQYERAF
ncbi:oxidoreductase [Rhodococcus sp. Leaf7]|uniref:NADH:flavin oxidoreductase/NADH oxidase n=1 Tax=unclassified Rhodococcus (in: high G+C Gram-positive bacteria) TaxID=192944 RepID=UPI0005AC77E1|nr:MULTISPECIES: NADH:flavin oxidoreductase/NADH oxidase [unclassified Rhodococcus (in: high G+C Gram-positive bacteria)]KIQ20375.1 oxidoreductase [Rhodococcus sp. MEB064]KQU02501.1 oxidoreductase [Rhodococcus sp. Leaf7]KQU37972.1 oxidoreductase [Rhodococcus sp. Leaf247]